MKLVVVNGLAFLILFAGIALTADEKPQGPEPIKEVDQLAMREVQVKAFRAALRAAEEEIRMLRAKVESLEAEARMRAARSEVTQHKREIDDKESYYRHKYHATASDFLTDELKWQKAPPQAGGKE